MLYDHDEAHAIYAAYEEAEKINRRMRRRGMGRRIAKRMAKTAVNLAILPNVAAGAALEAYGLGGWKLANWRGTAIAIDWAVPGVSIGSLGLLAGLVAIRPSVAKQTAKNTIEAFK